MWRYVLKLQLSLYVQLILPESIKLSILDKIKSV